MRFCVGSFILTSLGQGLAEIIDNNTEEEYLTIGEASKLLRVSKDQIYQWTSQTKHKLNDLPYKKRGKRLLFPKRALIKWIDSGKSR